jgi:hypothetical protein
MEHPEWYISQTNTAISDALSRQFAIVPIQLTIFDTFTETRHLVSFTRNNYLKNHPPLQERERVLSTTILLI